MSRSTVYQKIELGIALAGLLGGAGMLIFAPGPVLTIAPDRLMKWLGVALLGQGLIRDVVLLLSRGRGKAAGGEKKFLICLESTLGAGLVACSFLLAYLDPRQQFALSQAWLVLLFSALWLFGFATRDLVLEMRRDPNHLNLLVGFPGRSK